MNKCYCDHGWYERPENDKWWPCPKCNEDRHIPFELTEDEYVNFDKLYPTKEN